VIPRYVLPQMGAIWSEPNRLELLVRVERAVVRARARRGLVPADDLVVIERTPPPSADRIHQLDRELHHDVIAFLTAWGERIGPASRHVHYGMTSSDLIDTALAVQLVQAADLLLGRLDNLVETLRERALEHRDTLCLGRTHGVAAEPTTFGLKLAGHAFAFDRDRRRLAAAREAVAVGTVSGAVGTYAGLPAEVEAEVLAELDLRAEPAPTQVVARDRHAELLGAMALAGADLERLAVEVRHLQRTEVREAEEPFAEGQKGSSAMPHKRNPVVAERITGLARLLRGYAVSGLEDVALWHERDISHSSVERVVLPDACCVLDYALDRAIWLVGGLRVFPERMRANLDAAGGLAGSSAALLTLVDAGWTRERAYAAVQRAAMAAWEGDGGFRDLLLAEPGVAEALAGRDGGLDGALDPARFVAGAGPVFERLERLGRGGGRGLLASASSPATGAGR
jgi:adenylosuccinate lyase